MNKYMQAYFKIFPNENERAPSSSALGFFDGVHTGHRAVIREAAYEKANGLVPVCVTFSESPKSVLSGCGGNLLMTDSDKEKELALLGIERLYYLDFRELMNMSAEDFVTDVLIKRLNVKKVFCGFNYRFGKNGSGDTEKLDALCKKNAVELKIIPPVVKNGSVVSSTLIRELLSAGRVKEANLLLESKFGFSGEIIRGRRLGRLLGTPTINQALTKNMTTPKFGVYASTVTLESGKSFCGVTNIGVKPTVGSFSALCETWMPDYKGGDIYGQTADIRLLDFIRPEMKFPDIEALKTAILDNAETAKSIYSQVLGGTH